MGWNRTTQPSADNRRKAQDEGEEEGTDRKKEDKSEKQKEKKRKEHTELVS